MANLIRTLSSIDPRVSPIEAVALLRDCDGQECNPSGMARFFEGLAGHLERASHVADIRSVRRDHIYAWVVAPLPDGSRPSLATMHLRRSSARFAFRALRDLDVVDHDPTVDVVLESRPSVRATRPLTDEEIRRGRASSRRTPGDTRASAVWGLAETTATVSEVARVKAEDIDLAGGVVRLAGSGRVDDRLGVFTEWGMTAVDRHLRTVGDCAGGLWHEKPGRPHSSTRSMVTADLARVIKEAGLRRDRLVKIGSVRAWAGRRVWLLSGRIEEAALALGCRSLDTAAAIIDFDWR